MTARGRTVSELVELFKERGTRLPFEIGAFVAFSACEAVIERPVVLTPDQVLLDDDGGIRLVVAAPASPEEAARSVVSLLAHLLVAAGSEVPPAMLRLVERGPSGGQWDLHRLRDELEACLVPLNRAAAARVLSRLLREADRPKGRGGPGALGAVDEASVDADLDAFLAGEEAPPPSVRPEAPAPASHHPALPRSGSPTSLREVTPAPYGGSGSGVTSPSPAPLGGPVSASPSHPAAHDPAAVPALVSPSPAPLGVPVSAAPSHPGAPYPAPGSGPGPAPRAWPEPVPAPAPRGALLDDLDDDEDAPRPRFSPWVWVFASALLVAALIGGVLIDRPDVVARLLGDRSLEAEAVERAEEARREAERAAAARRSERYGDLVVTVTPDRAQVLLRVGDGPAIAENLPVGVAHEFVAIAEGREPTRAVIPPDAAWEERDGVPLYELAMQAGEQAMTFEALDLGATRLPRDVGSPTGRLGSVRVLTNPPGAAVYQLIGFSPSVRVRNIATDVERELVVFHEGYAPQRVRVGPEHCRVEGGQKLCEVEVQLVERARRRR